MTVSSTEGDAETGIAANEQDVNAAESSTVDPNEGVGSLEDAVDAVLKGEPEATPASDEQGPKEPGSETPEDDEISEEEMSRLSEKTQARMRRLVDARKTVEGEVANLRQEFDALKPKAERMDEIVGYMRENQIAPDHLNNALGLTAMINKGEFDRALPVLENLINQVRAAAGEVLPPDLQKRVELGYITEADAKVLHKSQVGERRTREELQRDRERSQAEKRQTEFQAGVDRAVRTADTWAQEQAQSDPDWNLKQNRVTELLELEVRRIGPEKAFTRPDKEWRDFLDQAKKNVETEIKRYRPAPKPVNPSPTGGSVSPRSQAKPASLMEAVDLALAKSE